MFSSTLLLSVLVIFILCISVESHSVSSYNTTTAITLYATPGYGNCSGLPIYNNPSAPIGINGNPPCINLSDSSIPGLLSMSFQCFVFAPGTAGCALPSNNLRFFSDENCQNFSYVGISAGSGNKCWKPDSWYGHPTSKAVTAAYFGCPSYSGSDISSSEPIFIETGYGVALWLNSCGPPIDDKMRLSGGAIIGIVLGSIIVVLLILVLSIYCYRLHIATKSINSRDTETNQMAVSIMQS